VSHIVIIRVAKISLRVSHYYIVVRRVCISGHFDFRVEQIVAYDGVFARRFTVSGAGTTKILDTFEVRIPAFRPLNKTGRNNYDVFVAKVFRASMSPLREALLMPSTVCRISFFKSLFESIKTHLLTPPL
jgi:hypothetical protein